jgi:predicted secreted protein
MGNKIKGSNVMIYRHNPDLNIDYLFACMRSADLSFEVDEKITNSQASAFWEESKPNVSRWMIAGDGLMVVDTTWNYVFMLNSVLNREKFNVKFVIDNGTVEGLTIVQGSVFFRTFALSAPYGDVATYAVEMKGSGQPSLSGTIVEGNTIIIQSTKVQVFQATATEGQSAISFAGAIGLELLYASRGGLAVQPLGILVGNGGTWTSGTATLNLATPAVGGELFLILVQ